MLYYISKVGNKAAVLDTDDGAIDWVSVDELKDFAKKVKIIGVAEGHPVRCTLDARKCNWSNGHNIFSSAKSFTCGDNVDFVLTTVDGKKYKGKVRHNPSNDSYEFLFSFNVYVLITKSIFDLIQNGLSSRSRVVEALRAFPNQNTR
jgi:hypothetical protein